jgi:hypothetical protein
VLEQAQTDKSAQGATTVVVTGDLKGVGKKPQENGQPMSPQETKAAAQAAAQEKQNAQIAGLLLGSPEFQRR